MRLCRDGGADSAIASLEPPSLTVPIATHRIEHKLADAGAFLSLRLPGFFNDLLKKHFYPTESADFTPIPANIDNAKDDDL